mmetsp:Transcript_15378/g.32490  ORF Transcript_15378/g.32490 Transcript_15378/m.32490 type:complete len:425 (-) Transcript_15378:792-2066(-)
MPRPVQHVGGRVLQREPRLGGRDGARRARRRRRDDRARRRLVRPAQRHHLIARRLGAQHPQVPLRHPRPRTRRERRRHAVRAVDRAGDGLRRQRALPRAPGLVLPGARPPAERRAQPAGARPHAERGARLRLRVDRRHATRGERGLRQVGHEPPPHRGLLRLAPQPPAGRGAPPVRAWRVRPARALHLHLPTRALRGVLRRRRPLRLRHALLLPASLGVGQHGRAHAHEDPARLVVPLPQHDRRRALLHGAQPHHPGPHPKAHARPRRDVRHLRLRARPAQVRRLGGRPAAAGGGAQARPPHRPRRTPLPPVGPLPRQLLRVAVRPPQEAARRPHDGGVGRRLRIQPQLDLLVQPDAAAAAARARRGGAIRRVRTAAKQPHAEERHARSGAHRRQGLPAGRQLRADERRDADARGHPRAFPHTG